MKLRSFAFCLFLGLAVTGCMGPSSKIESGRYNDYRRNVCFATPPSWRQVRTVPPNFLPRANLLSGRTKCSLGRSDDLSFINSNGSGVIAMQLDQSTTDASQLSAQEIQTLAEQAQTSRREMLSKAFQISDYQFHVTPNFITEEPWHLVREQFRYRTGRDFVMETHLYVFRNENKNTCCLRAMLFSEAGSAEENRQVLERVLKTIKRIGAEEQKHKELVRAN